MALAQEKFYTEEDYENLPEDARAELIDGRIYAQAAPSRVHQKILAKLSRVIGNYIEAKGGDCEVYPAPFAVKLFADEATIVEPDISVICDHDKLTERGCTGAPDWIVEIVSPGNSAHDYVRKLSLYMDAGVREYWIVDPAKQKILLYHLKEGDFEVRQYSFTDRVQAGIYEDLYIDFNEIDLT